MTSEETRSSPGSIPPPGTVSQPSDLQSPAPDPFAGTQTGSDGAGPNATRSQVTPTPTAPHLSASRDSSLTPPGYTITGELGRGGMGVVYAATDDRLKREVALKMLLRSGDERRLVRFLIEAEAMAQVRHPNVVQVFEAGETGGQPFLALEYLPGGTLAAKLSQGRLPIRDALKLMLKIARGVEAAHRQGIVHRDLKPGNVMFDAHGEPKVTDFGLAKHGTKDLTATDAMMGTPAYMAPEQAKGETKTAGPAADVFSLGVMLYELTTGTRPFTGDTAGAIVYKVIHETPETPRRREPSIPRDVEIIIFKCLGKDPGGRYADAGKLADDLERLLSDKPITARAVGPVERGVKWVRRNPVIAASFLITTTALILGSGVSYWKYLDAKTALENASHQVNIANFLLAVAANEKHDAVLAQDRLALIPPEHRRWEWHYLKRQIEGGVYTLRGHTSRVTGVAYSPDGSQIVTAGLDKTVRLWDSKTGLPLFEFKGREAISCVSFSPDGTRIATGKGYDGTNLNSDTGTVTIWDVKSGREILDFVAAQSAISGIAFSPDGNQIATSGLVDSGTAVKIWDASTGAPLIELKGKMRWAASVAYSPDGQRVVTAGTEEGAPNVEDVATRLRFFGPDQLRPVARPRISVWDAATGFPLATMQGLEKAGIVQCVKFSPDGRQLAVGYGGTECGIWDVMTGREVMKLNGPRAPINDLAFSPDGTRIVPGRLDKTAKVWDVKTGVVQLDLRGHTDSIDSVMFSPDGTLIVTGSADRTAKVWDANTGNPHETLTVNTFDGKVQVAAFSPDGSQIFAAPSFSGGDEAGVWDVRTGSLLFGINGHEDRVRSATYSPDGTLIFTEDESGRTKAWDAKTGSRSLDAKYYLTESYPCFSANGCWVATGTSKQTTQIRDAKTGTSRVEISLGASPNAFNTDGTRIALARGATTMPIICDAKTGKLLVELKADSKQPVGRLMFGPDSKSIAGSFGNTAMIWDAGTGLPSVELKWPNGQVKYVCFSPDGTRIVSACADVAVIWDAKTGTPLIELEGHTKDISCVAFSPDGRRIATAAYDGTVRIWNNREISDPFGAEELAYHKRCTRPRPEWHHEQARKFENIDPYAAAFHLWQEAYAKGLIAKEANDPVKAEQFFVQAKSLAPKSLALPRIDSPMKK